MKLFFKGYYGFENLGDDIFVHTAVWFCKRYQYEYLIHGYNLPSGVRGKKVTNKCNKYLTDIIYSIKSDYIIYWGGSTFERISSKTDLKYYLNKLKFLKKKVLTMGISIGPFKSEKRKKEVINFINRIKFSGVRDKASLEYSNSSIFTFDLAIITPLIFPVNEQRKDKLKFQKEYVITLNISNADNFNEYINIYKEFLLKNKKQIKEINLVVFNPNDYEISLSLYNEFKNMFNNINLIEYTNDTKYIIEKIATSDLVLGNRLHSAIIAYSYNIPFILNEYHKKCSDFLDTIDMKYKYRDLKNGEKINITEVIDKTSNFINPRYFREILLKKMDQLAKVIYNENL
ncbi:polysaccharide pyruvyl transferase family protein [Staphylococcus saprophyticus]|uniref:polysaccharide pyruvyl transferase family protein n=1 Tax=Staphylococcus saprophyticus TaxID=29385 RepID=UPI00381917C9